MPRTRPTAGLLSLELRLVFVAGLTLLPGATSAQEPVIADEPTAAGAADALSAREIYSRVLENSFDSAAQELRIESIDRAGRQQDLRLQMLWKRYEGGREAAQGIRSRTVVRYLEPSDVRRTGYLVVNKLDKPSDQFIYLNSLRRVRRINLRSESIVGTDLSVEDVVPRELDDATYTRIPDAEVEGTPCFVVEAVPKPDADSSYSKFWLYVESGHYVPLRIRYWDASGVEVKELESALGSIREIDGIFVPIRSRMRHLLAETSTNVVVDMLVPNPDLPSRYFSQHQLESKRLNLPDEVTAAAAAF